MKLISPENIYSKMEDFLINPPKLGAFVRITFYLLFSVVGTIFIAMIFLQINDSVRASSGEIFSRNPPVEYRSSHEAEVKRVICNEGDTVKRGDTLLLLHNDALLSDYTKIKENYFLEQLNLNLDKEELETMGKKTEEIEKQKQLLRSNSSYNRQNIDIELKDLDQKIEAATEKLEMSETRLEKDKALFKEGIISQEDFENKRKVYLEALNQLSETRAAYQLKFAAQTGNKNAYSERLRQLNLNWINMEQEMIQLKKQIFQKETLIETLGVQMEFLAKEMKRLTVLAEQDGIVATVFNEQLTTRFISKGTLLAIVRPLEEAAFFARLQVSQSAIAKVKNGQAIHLKLKAYNFYQYGILKGTVAGIHPKDSTNQFYLLVEIPRVPAYFNLQSGYQVKGDVILKRMPLYRYVLNGLFGKLQSPVSQRLKFPDRSVLTMVS
jgi:multidrug efflux pump subunit AcrA (membrane-fusion protein)